MKKVLIGLLLMTSISAKAQIVVDGVDINKLDSVQYVEILGIDQGLFQRKLQIIVDYGQKFKWGTDARIQNAQGTVMQFNTMVHPLNFFSANGWEFVTTYAVSIGQSSVYHTLLRRKK